MALVLGALATLNRWTGVKTANIEINGQPVALAILSGARFGEDPAGHTTLAEVIEIEAKAEKEFA